MEQADIPALEIECELSLHVSKDMCRKKTAAGRHGPSFTRDNDIVSMVHDQHQQRIYVGMQLGEVMFWDLKRPNSKDVDMLYSRHSSHKLVGSHAVSEKCFSSLVEARDAGILHLEFPSASREQSTVCVAFNQQHSS